MAKLLTGTRIYGTGTVDTQLFVSGTNSATSTTTGALQVVGGVGIGGNLYVGGTIFGGILSGTASTATNSDNIKTVLQTANAAYYPAFVDSNNSTAAYEALYTTSSFVINPQSGNVGVGTTSPSRKLDVEIQTASLTTGSVLNAHSIAEFINLSAGGSRGLEIGSPADSVTAPVYLKVVGTGSRFAIVNQSDSEQFTILTGGNVGIGFTAPNGKLDVAGDLYVGATQNTARFKSDNTNTFVDAIPGAGAVVIRAGGSVEKLRVTANGGISFGASGTAYGVSGQILQSNGDAAPTWISTGSLAAANATTATHLSGGVAGQIPYQTAPGVTSFLSTGTAGDVLVSNGSSAATYNNTLRLAGSTNATSTTSGALQVVGGVGVGGDLFIQGDIRTNDTLFNLINGNATTVNFAGDATTLTMGASGSGTTNVRNNLTVSGNLTVQGTTTIVDSTVTNIADPIITLGGGAGNTAPTADDNKDRGIAFKWVNNGGTTSTGFFGYDDSTGYLTYIQTATITNEVVSGTKGAVDANLAGGSAMALVYQSAADTTAFLAAGTSGYILQTNGTGSVPSWVSASGVSAGSATNADNIRTVAQTANATYYPTFVDSNNASNAYELVYTTSSFQINPFTGNIQIGMTGQDYQPSSGSNHTLRLNAANTSSIGFHDSGSTIGNLKFSANYGFEIGAYDGLYGPHNTILHGSVGIGTQSPGAKLEVYASRTASTNVVALLLNDNVTGAQTNGVYKAIRSQSNGGTSVSEIRFVETDGTNNNTGIAFATAATAGGLTERMRVGPSGNVGIGTTDPNSRLDVRFAALSSTSQLNHILLQSLADGANNQLGARTGITFNNRTVDYASSGGTSTAGVYGVSTDNNVYARSLGLVFYTSVTDAAATEKLRITSAGGIAFGGAANYGTSGFVLKSNGDAAPTWVDPSTLASASATNADNIRTVAQTASATYYPTFVDSNNASNAYESVYTTSSFSINPAAGLITIASPLGGDGVPALKITQGAAPGTFNWLSSFLNSSLTAGKNLINLIGQAESANNSAYFGFKYVGAGSASNFATIGLYGADNLVNILASGFVGIGNTAPGFKLSVNTAADVWHAQFGTSGGKQLRIGGSTTNGSVIGAYNDDSNSSPASLLLNRDGGNVGIGTNAPTTKLEITDGIAYSGAKLLTLSRAEPTRYNAYAGFGDWAGGNKFAWKFGTTNNYVDYPALYIVDGSVGIGTTAPDSKLHVEVGNATAYTPANTLVSGQTARISNTDVTSGVSANLLFVAKGAGGGNGLGSISGVNTGVGSLAFTFGTRHSSSNVTERMRITSDGNVGIGTSNPINKFEVAGTAGQLFSVSDSFTGTIFSVNDVSGIPSIEVLDTGLVKIAQYNGQVAINTGTVASSTASLSVYGMIYTMGTLGEIRASSEITAYYSSDRRLKENIKLIENPITIIDQIRGVTFDWTDEHIARRGGEDGYFVRKHDIGVIAQEVQAVLPELVGTREDGYLAVKYEKMVPLLIEAIKSQQKTIDTLTSEIKEIKEFLSSLKNN